ncbi:ATP-dependent helicase HrpB [Corynebacterium ulceribovis]|uniref:ATP-dependent helicase HrpB n=1 Tax=Corynebacterium ulceribovis TaxID=487732 RepID=UPI00036499AD|nr:ATP-dependent helicase HrpB [Corynebacterium ulceribovis]
MQHFDLPTIGAGLPVAEALGRFASAAERGAVVVQAPPGTGKTTLIPPAVSEMVSGTVLVTQPRRVAVRAAARRLAQLSGTQLGREVGYTVRGDRKVSAATVVEFVTPGVLLRRLLRDPELPGVAAVVLDEVHERQLDTDIALGMLADLRQLREDLLVVAMSATVDAPKFAALLGDGHSAAPVVDTPAVLHPLAVLWRPAPGPRLGAFGVEKSFLTHIADVSTEALESAAGDILVFLPGAREVDAVVGELRRRVGGGDVEVLPLHGGLTPAQQDRAVSGGSAAGRRIIVATDIAESSLTVPGVRTVVDAGLSRQPRLDLMRGMSGLVTVSEARSSGEQRAGRAARQGPGQVFRCFSESEWTRFPTHITPEVAAADLTEAALLLACWGTPRGAGLRLIDPLPTAAADAAEKVLRALSAIDDDGAATEMGHQIAAMPTSPRLARALLVSAPEVGVRTAAEVVACLSLDTRHDGGDLGRTLSALRRGAHSATKQWRRDTERLEKIAQRTNVTKPTGAHSTTDSITAAANTDALVVAAAWPDRLAQQRGTSTEYLLASGTGAALPPDSGLSGQPWLAVADVTRAAGKAGGASGAIIRAAIVISEDDALAAGAALHTDEVSADYSGGKIRGYRRSALGAIELGRVTVTPTPAAAQAAVQRALTTVGLGTDDSGDSLRRPGDKAAASGQVTGMFRFSAEAETLRRRIALLHNQLGAPWPAVDSASLIAAADLWLGPELDAVARGTDPKKFPMLTALQRLLPWPEAARLDELAPERLEVASGSTVRLHYPPIDEPDGQPVCAVKLQECFGWAESPTVADGRVPIVFHLLSPAGRDLAVTADLASFWETGYPQVRAEMRGRYPKHPWPEDPWSAEATVRVKHPKRR